MFTSSHRGVANGIFSWGVYYGYGLAFVFGIYITDADVLGYGWRAPYVLAGLPGILIAILILLTFSDPRDEKKNEDKEINNREENFAKWFFKYLKKLFRNFCSPTMIILVFAGEFINPNSGGFRSSKIMVKIPFFILLKFLLNLEESQNVITPEAFLH